MPHLNIWEIRRLMMSRLTDSKLRSDRFRCGLYGVLPARERRRRGLSRFEGYFKFGFVRNPWDRVVSLYLRREGDQVHRSKSFEEFVKTIRYSSATCLHPSPHVNQLDWLVDPSGRVVVDYIGRFETLQQDWNNICATLGIASRDLPVKKQNHVARDHYSKFYTRETADLIADRFRADIDFFGYEFEWVE